MAVIYQGLGAAEQLHGNFYEVYMTPNRAALALANVRPLLEILYSLLPPEYTDSATFDQWCQP